MVSVLQVVTLSTFETKTLLVVDQKLFCFRFKQKRYDWTSIATGL